ncbi:MAG: hypothetical protein NVSMB19_22390 [Vulcanimicrobiaceae bacterium]
MELAFIGRLLGACVVIALVLGGVQLVAARLGRARRLGRGVGGGGPLLSLVETTYLPGAAALHVVRIAERYYVVGRNAAALATLAEIPAESVDRWREGQSSAARQRVAPARRFASRLRGRPP